MPTQRSTTYGARVFIIVLLVFIAAILWMFGERISGLQTNTQNDDRSLTPAAALFAVTVQQRTLNVLGGIPREGLEPNMVLSAYPGIFASDFHGVSTHGGHYELERGELIYKADPRKPQSTASASLSSYSFGNLLENIARRIGMPITTEEEVKQLLKQLDMVTQKVSFVGTFVCLPHREGFPPTEECSFGIKDKDNQYYALDLNAVGSNALSGMAAGDTVHVEGLMTPIEMLSTNFWQKYNLFGIISVSKIEMVKAQIERI